MTPGFTIIPLRYALTVAFETVTIYLTECRVPKNISYMNVYYTENMSLQAIRPTPACRY